MSKLFIILFLVASVSAFAQTADKDTIANFTTIMVDGRVTSSKLVDMDGHNILLIEKFISPQEVGSSRNNVMIKVTTKAFATKQYQQKLMGLSKEYAAYLDGSKGDDTELMYVINGLVIEQRDSLSKKLYEIPVKKIKAVAYLGKNKGGDNYLPIVRSVVVITTKK